MGRKFTNEKEKLWSQAFRDEVRSIMDKRNLSYGQVALKTGLTPTILNSYIHKGVTPNFARALHIINTLNGDLNKIYKAGR